MSIRSINGVVTGYRGGMLNLHPVCSASSVVLFCVLLFHSCIFMSCNFMSCKLVRQFHVQHFLRPRIKFRFITQWCSVGYLGQGRTAINFAEPKVVRCLIPPYYPHFCRPFCRPSWLLSGAVRPFRPSDGPPSSLATPLLIMGQTPQPPTLAAVPHFFQFTGTVAVVAVFLCSRLFWYTRPA